MNADEKQILEIIGVYPRVSVAWYTLREQILDLLPPGGG